MGSCEWRKVKYLHLFTVSSQASRIVSKRHAVRQAEAATPLVSMHSRVLLDTFRHTHFFVEWFFKSGPC